MKNNTAAGKYKYPQKQYAWQTSAGNTRGYNIKSKTQIREPASTLTILPTDHAEDADDAVLYLEEQRHEVAQVRIKNYGLTTIGRQIPTQWGIVELITAKTEKHKHTSASTLQ